MKSVKRSDIKPETIYATECPYCNELTYVCDNEDDICEDQDFECEKCCLTIEIIEDNS